MLAGNAEELKRLPPVQRNFTSDGPFAQANVLQPSVFWNCQAYLDQTVACSTQIHRSWYEACGRTLRLWCSMAPIFRSCLIEDDLMALTPPADDLFQFSIWVRESQSSRGFSG